MESQNWGEVLIDIQALKKTDKANQLFGARSHKYEIHPIVDTSIIAYFEDKFKVGFPSEIRNLYAHVGNGEAGTFYGMKRIEELSGYSPELEYPGVQYYKDLAKKMEISMRIIILNRSIQI